MRLVRISMRRSSSQYVLFGITPLMEIIVFADADIEHLRNPIRFRPSLIELQTLGIHSPFFSVQTQIAQWLPRGGVSGLPKNELQNNYNINCSSLQTENSGILNS